MTLIGESLASTPYSVERMLGVGGMAEVYLARERLVAGGERRVVLKRLHPQHHDDEELVTLFFDEARAGVLMRHPHVVEVYGALHCGRDCLIAMEYVPGPTLGQLLRAAASTSPRVLPEPEAVAIGRTLAETMDWVHRLTDVDGTPLHVVHRDLNPANVIVSRTGTVKIIDFGIARGDNRVHETATGMVKGTAGYMAPEQLESTGDPDARTDVFALGVVLYELFAGRQPFATKNLLELRALITRGRYVMATEARPGLAPALAELVHQCLQPDPSARPQSMREVADALSTHLVASGYTPAEAALVELVRQLVPDEREDQCDVAPDPRELSSARPHG